MDDKQEPLVSICCHTYNHEKYIRDAIEGFLMQDADFPFEIIIHDDASTDMTADIVREYEKKHPELIKPIYQTENQYSKGIKPSQTTFKIAKGKYIALCEGDDYWTDPLKLQKQFEAMERYPECDMSFHPALMIYEDEDSKKNEYQTYLKSGNRIISTGEIIRKGGGYCPTASLMLKKSVLLNLPEWFNDAPVGDYYLQILGALRGGAIYIDSPMSVYRKNVIGSWSSSTKNVDNLLRNKKQIVETSEQLNKDLGYMYDEQFKFQEAFAMYNVARELLLKKRYLEFKECIERSWDIYPQWSTKQIFLYYFRRIPVFVLLPTVILYLKKCIVKKITYNFTK